MTVINLTKGQVVNLSKGNPGLTKVMIGLGWDTADTGIDFDLDASVFLVGADEKVTGADDFVFFNQLVGGAGSVKHHGDNLTGAGDGDDEMVSVDLTKVPAHVQKVIFAITIHEAGSRGQNFGQVNNAFARIVNEATNEELARYDLAEDFSFETAVIIGSLNRTGNEWSFQADGSGYPGELSGLVQRFGLNVG